MTYYDELTKAMTWLGEQPDTVFLGQQMRYPGNGLFKTLSGVPMEKRIELGIMEDAQLGISIGMAMAGKRPITVYPRMDFLLLAMNQLVNHLDKYPVSVIIRVCVGGKKPLDPGPQHCGDYSEGLKHMLKNVQIACLRKPQDIMRVYSLAYKFAPVIVVEYGDLYRMDNTNDKERLRQEREKVKETQ